MRLPLVGGAARREGEGEEVRVEVSRYLLDSGAEASCAKPGEPSSASFTFPPVATHPDGLGVRGADEREPVAAGPVFLVLTLVRMARLAPGLQGNALCAFGHALRVRLLRGAHG